MADYIDREKVLKILKGYSTINGSSLGRHSGAVDCAMEQIEMLSVNNVDSIIHCKGCAKDGLTTCPLCWIEEHTLQFVDHDPEFYCGEAERKE